MGEETVPIPGARDVVATHQPPSNGDRHACVVGCPPHPEFGGHRGDKRLTAVGDSLAAAGLASLRFDYGAWDDGYGEREDARNALRWAGERYDHVGCFGYSFGGAIAILAVADYAGGVDALSVLAPTAELTTDLDAVAALDDIACPVQVVVGTRDDTADWRPIADHAEELGFDVVELRADHHFVGQLDTIAETVTPFFRTNVG